MESVDCPAPEWFYVFIVKKVITLEPTTKAGCAVSEERRRTVAYQTGAGTTAMCLLCLANLHLCTIVNQSVHTHPTNFITRIARLAHSCTCTDRC